MAFSAHQRRRALHFAAMPTAIRITALALTAVAATALTSATGVASPFCFETGPGYQKCVVSGHDLTPTYQGPKIYDGGNVPWAPTYSPPIAPAPPPAGSSAHALDQLAGVVLNSIQNTFDADPANTQADIRVLNVSLTQTGDTSFEGVAAMTSRGGAAHDIPVHVFNAGGTLNWKIDPGVMAVLAE